MTEPLSPKMIRRFRLGRVWATTWRALVKYNETDGEQRAASVGRHGRQRLAVLAGLLVRRVVQPRRRRRHLRPARGPT